MQEFVVGPEQVGLRVDVFLANQYKEFARSALEVLFEKKLVNVNEQLAKPSTKLKEGDSVSVNESILFVKPKEIDIPVIYEDQNVVVMNKPAGVLTHAKGAINNEGSIATFLQPRLNDESLNGNRAGIVHRLDRATSGVIIGAKNADATLHLQKQFSKRNTKKTYIAIVEGWLKDKHALIDAPIERNPNKPQTFRVGAAGKTAQTEYNVLQEFTKNGKEYSELELKPVTGRTHQLRVHLYYVDHPIVGDRVYGKEGPHMYLHAKSLEVTLPGGERKVFEAPVPKIFEEFISNE